VGVAAGPAGTTSPVGELLDERASGGCAAVSPSGGLGDPRLASAEAGRTIIDRWVGELIAVLTAKSTTSKTSRPRSQSLATATICSTTQHQPVRTAGSGGF